MKKYILIYIVGIISMCLFSTFGAMIPRSAIEKHSQESSNYLMNHPNVYEEMVKGDKGSKVDRYADSIMLNMAYCQDENDPFLSAMAGAYYDNGILPRTIEDYHSTVNNKQSANTRYTRYWHGSIPIVKAGLIFGNLEQIYIGYAILLISLCTFLVIVIMKRKNYALLISFIVGAIGINLYCVPFSLEYAPIFLIILGGCLVSIYLNKERLYPFLFILGMMTCYFDFLTIETLAYTLPLFFFIVFHEYDELRDWKAIALFLIKTGIVWIIGYGMTYLAKWGISAVLFGKEELLIALGNANYRFSGMQYMSVLKQILYAIMNPILALKPFAYTTTYGGVIVVAGILGLILFVIYYLLKKEKRKSWTGLEKVILLLCIVPYIRYIVLNNHSSMHWFFTFRAQMITIVGLFYIYLRKLDYTLIFKREEKALSKEIKN